MIKQEACARRPPALRQQLFYMHRIVVTKQFQWFCCYSLAGCSLLDVCVLAAGTNKSSVQRNTENAAVAALVILLTDAGKRKKGRPQCN